MRGNAGSLAVRLFKKDLSLTVFIFLIFTMINLDKVTIANFDIK